MHIAQKYEGRADLSEGQKRRYTLEDRIAANSFARGYYRFWNYTAPGWLRESYSVVMILCGMPFLVLGFLSEAVLGEDSVAGLILLCVAFILAVLFVPYAWIAIVLTAIFMLWLLSMSTMSEYGRALERWERMRERKK